MSKVAANVATSTLGMDPSINLTRSGGVVPSGHKPLSRIVTQCSTV